jgi:DNA ligase-1
MPDPETQSAAALARWAEICEALGATTKKLEKRAILAAYLRGLSVADAGRAAQSIAGAPFAETDPRKLNVGGSLLTKAVAHRTGASAVALSHAFRRHGDLGAAAAELIATGSAVGQRLTLATLETLLAELAAARGPRPKLAILNTFLARAGALEAKYTLKLLSGDMRIGVKQALVEEAIAAAYERELSQVRHAGMVLGSLAETVARAVDGTLESAPMRLFHSLGFMLASPVESADEAIERFAAEVFVEAREEVDQGVPADAASRNEGAAAPAVLREAFLEDKYDGIRAQLHAGDGSVPGRVGLYSRSREDLSAAFPELIEAFAALSSPVILDGEILAWQPASAGEGAEDLAGARALPFSSLQARLGRKVVTAELRRSVPVVFMAFDILYAEGELLLEEPLAERRSRLEGFVAQHAALTDGRASVPAAAQTLLFPEREETPEAAFPRLLLAPSIRLHSAAQLDAAYTAARARGNEGVMLKAAGSRYQPGRRGLAWLKLKRELATLDVVVTGAEFGHGRRAGYLSDYTFAVRGPEYEQTGELLNVGKAYSGITDAEMYALSAHFHETTLEDHGHFRTVQPDTVLEVAFNNLMRSSRHASGFALRFPRILRIRDDKPVEEIDTLARVEEIYKSQPDKPVENA